MEYNINANGLLKKNAKLVEKMIMNIKVVIGRPGKIKISEIWMIYLVDKCFNIKIYIL